MLQVRDPAAEQQQQQRSGITAALTHRSLPLGLQLLDSSDSLHIKRREEPLLLLSKKWSMISL